MQSYIHFLKESTTGLGRGNLNCPGLPPWASFLHPRNPAMGGTDLNIVSSPCGGGPKLHSRPLRHTQWVVGHNTNSLLPRNTFIGFRDMHVCSCVIGFASACCVNNYTSCALSLYCPTLAVKIASTSLILSCVICSNTLVLILARLLWWRWRVN